MSRYRAHLGHAQFCVVNFEMYVFMLSKFTLSRLNLFQIKHDKLKAKSFVGYPDLCVLLFGVMKCKNFSCTSSICTDESLIGGCSDTIEQK